MTINQNLNNDLKINVAAMDPVNKIVAGSPPAPCLHQISDPFKDNDLRDAFLSCCNIPEIKTLSKINRTFKAITESDIQWKDIGDTYFETPLATKEQIKNYILTNKQQAHKCFDSAKISISLKKKLEKLYNSERIQDIKLLRSLCKARDILIVWDALKVSLGGNQDFNLDNFTSIEEVCAQATGFPIWFEQNLNQLKTIQRLNLQDKNLISLPPQIYKLTGLQSLFLYHNQLTALSSEIGNLRGLETLTLGNNQLKALPPEIGNLIKLKQLFLQDNLLATLPPEIGNLINLEFLAISHNKLKALPPEIGNCTHLEVIHMFHNQLTSLPLEWKNLNLIAMSKNNPWPNVDIDQDLDQIIDDADINKLEFVIATKRKTVNEILQLAINAGSIDVVKWLYRRGAVNPEFPIRRLSICELVAGYFSDMLSLGSK